MHHHPNEPRPLERTAGRGGMQRPATGIQQAQETAAPAEPAADANPQPPSVSAADAAAKPIDFDHDHGAEVDRAAPDQEDDEGLMAKIVADGRQAGF